MSLLKIIIALIYTYGFVNMCSIPKLTMNRRKQIGIPRSNSLDRSKHLEQTPLIKSKLLLQDYINLLRRVNIKHFPLYKSMVSR